MYTCLCTHFYLNLVLAVIIQKIDLQSRVNHFTDEQMHSDFLLDKIYVYLCHGLYCDTPCVNLTHFYVSNKSGDIIIWYLALAMWHAMRRHSYF